MIQQGSCDCTKTELDMESIPPTMTTMQGTQWSDYHPIASLDSHHAPIEFLIPPHTEFYTDLSQAYLYIKFRILKQTGEDLDMDAKVFPINNFFHSMFSGIDLYINNKLITNNSDTYPYRAYLENLFSYGSDVKDNQLKAAEFWPEDEAGAFEDITNASITDRGKRVAKSKSVELQGKLHLDLAMQEKYLPNGLEFKLRLNRSSPQFCLMSDNYPAKIKIDTAILRVRNVQLLPAISNELNQTIAHHNAKFPIRRVEVKTFTISSGTRSKIEDHLLTGQLPKRVFIGLVTNEAFNGNLDTNPFFFQHFNLSKMDVTCDEHSVYGKPFEPRFDVIDAFNTTSRYLDDILNINNVYFDNMVSQIYPSELQLNKANASDTEAAFLDLHLSISNDIVSTKIYDKRDDFDFEIVNFPFLDGDVPRSTSYGVYISQLIRFARASSYVADFNTRNKLLTQKLLKQGYRYHKLRKTFSKFYRRYYDLISKFQVGLKSLLRQGLLEPDFYGDLVYKLKRIVGSNNFSAQFIKIISHYKKIGYNINVLQQTACLVVNPITVGNFAFLFNCTPVGRTSDSMMVPT